MALTVGDGGASGDSSYVPEGDRSAALGSGGRFMVDPDRVPVLLGGIDDAVSQLRKMLIDIDRVARIAPPGRDPFSADATTAFGQTADGGQSSLKDVHLAYIDLLLETRAQIAQNSSSAENQDSATATGLGAGN